MFLISKDLYQKFPNNMEVSGHKKYGYQTPKLKIYTGCHMCPTKIIKKTQNRNFSEAIGIRRKIIFEENPKSLKEEKEF